MALDFFSVERGFEISDENAALVQILTGSGAPGGDTGEQDDSPIGSIYLDQGGDFYFKIADADAAADWVSPAAETPGSTITQSSADGVTTATTVDTVLVDGVVASHWWVHVEEATPSALKRAVEIYATHDNIDGGADATTVDWTKFARLKIGATITGLVIDIVLAGTAVAQTMGLQVTSTTSVDVRAARVDVLA